jgi:hypothetical protein
LVIATQGWPSARGIEPPRTRRIQRADTNGGPIDQTDEALARRLIIAVVPFAESFTKFDHVLFLVFFVPFVFFVVDTP